MAKVKANLSLHPKQMEVYQCKKRFRVVVAGRRWGKTALSRVLIIKRAQMPRQKIWYVAPTYRMAKQIMWTDLLEAIPPKWIRKINETTLSITLVNSTRIELKGADKADSLRGVGLNFLVLDEFQDMSQDTWTKVLRPTLADKQGDAIFIGTPKAYNYLYEVYKNGTRGEYYEDEKGRLRKNTWQSWQFPTITSPFIPLSEIESAKHDMDDKSFKQEFEACHLPETEVVMWNGKVKQIQHIKPGELTRHLSDDGIIEPCEVLAVGETGVKCVIDATLETGDIISASAHHKFKVHHESGK
ncbi:TPA: phage terminase large subunit [Escherichia coli]|nr:phage terminase large subunit [Escherichia coli]HCJ8610362.1 phage terminase large subunit [Escherichia coli]